MRKTGQEIESDVFSALKKSGLKAIISGNIYYSGTRPTDSSSEDAVVSFLTGDHDQIQQGYVNVNIYVSDIDIGANKGILIKNVRRCQEIEAKVRDWADSLSLMDEYRFKPSATIKTFQEENIKQHFINCKLKFNRSTF